MLLDQLVLLGRAQARPHLSGEARAGGAHKRAPALRGAPPREAGERGRGGCGGGGGASWGRVRDCEEGGGGVGEDGEAAEAWVVESLVGTPARRWWA